MSPTAPAKGPRRRQPGQPQEKLLGDDSFSDSSTYTLAYVNSKLLSILIVFHDFLELLQSLAVQTMNPLVCIVHTHSDLFPGVAVYIAMHQHQAVSTVRQAVYKPYGLSLEAYIFFEFLFFGQRGCGSGLLGHQESTDCYFDNQRRNS